MPWTAGFRAGFEPRKLGPVNPSYTVVKLSLERNETLKLNDRSLAKAAVNSRVEQIGRGANRLVTDHHTAAICTHWKVVEPKKQKLKSDLWGLDIWMLDEVDELKDFLDQVNDG